MRESAEQASPDEELLRRARGGDNDAFRMLVERYEDQVAATIKGMLGSGSDADEIGQRVFVKFFDSLNDFRGDAALGTYLTRIAINLCLNEQRRQKRWYRRFISRDGEAPLPEPRSNHEEHMLQYDMQELLEKALQSLSDKHRAVVVLRLVEGRSTRETADILQVAEGTVLSRLARAKSELRNLLAPYVKTDGGSTS